MAQSAPPLAGPPNTEPIPAPLQGTITEIHVAQGDTVRPGQLLFVMSALKMEHVIKAEFGGIVRALTVDVGEVVYDAHPLAFIEPRDVGEGVDEAADEVAIDYIRPSLQAVFDRRQFLLDENRPAAVERRHSRGRRTVRENIEQLIDPDTWVEYGALAIAGQSRKRSLEELIWKTPPTASSPASAPSTATSSTPSARAPSSSPTTTPCSRARREGAATTRPTA